MHRFALYALLALFLSVPLAVADEALEVQVQAIADTTMSPFCPGRTLSACPSPQARELRAQIMEWLKKGYTETGVRNQLQMIYGQEVKGKPDSDGFGIFAWVTPIVFVLAFLAAILTYIRKTRKPVAVVTPAAEATPDMTNQVEAELQRRMK